MTNKQVLVGNKLIAEFMGDDFFESLGFTYQKPMFTTGKILSKDCKFHTSWDWLMPAVEKIESIKPCFLEEIHGFSVIISENSCEIYSIEDDYGQIDECIVMFQHVDSNKIQNTWQTIIQFIEWYNKQNHEIFSSKTNN